MHISEIVLDSFLFDTSKLDSVTPPVACDLQFIFLRYKSDEEEIVFHSLIRVLLFVCELLRIQSSKCVVSIHVLNYIA